MRANLERIAADVNAGSANGGWIPAIAGKTDLQGGRRKAVSVRFGVWLLLGLEFELGADIIRTAISPTWTQIGQLASIAVIRTFLNHFLEQELEKYEVADGRGDAHLDRPHDVQNR